jgi:formate dehydrogenase major subunit
VTAVEVRRTNHYSDWQEKNNREEIDLKKIAPHVLAAE